MAKAVGIDLGTTNSVVAVMEDGAPVIIPNAEGQLTTPSVVGFSPEDELLVGQAALDQAVTHPARTASSFKRQMGLDWTADLGAYQYRPQELAARILQKLKRDAEAYVGEPITAAVISVPGRFTHAQRLATRQAGQIAGFETVRLISEPSAATLAYTRKSGPTSQKLILLDLGSGYCEASVFDVTGSLIQVKSIQGKVQFGGSEWDDAIVDWLVHRLDLKNSVDLAENSTVKASLKDAAEQAKKRLSCNDVTSIDLSIARAADAPILDVSCELTRTEFQDATKKLTWELTTLPRSAFLYARTRNRDIKRGAIRACVMGGMARLPTIQDSFRKLFAPEIRTEFPDEELVALGAAIHASVMMEEVATPQLHEVTPFGLGIVMSDGEMAPRVREQAVIPLRYTEVWTTAAENQQHFVVRVVGADHYLSEKCTSIDEYSISGIREAWPGIPQIGISFEIDADGIVSVTAEDIDIPDDPLTVSGELWLIDFEVDHEFPDEELSEIPHDTGEFEPKAEDVHSSEDLKMAASGIADLARLLLPVLDSCEDVRQDESANAAVVDVVRGIENQLLSALARVGVSPISPVGEFFNPYEHELALDSDGQSPADGVGATIAGVFCTGYRTFDRILRPATVYVEATPQPAESSTSDVDNQPPNATDPAAAPNRPADG